MAQDNEEFTVRLSIEDGSESFPQKEIGFCVRDSIYSPFPEIEVVYADITGLALEYGAFIQGVKMHLSYGEQENLMDLIFRSIERNTVKATGSRPQLSGVLKVRGVHESYFDDRGNPKKSFTKKTVTDVVKDLFPAEADIDIESTQGKVNLYAFGDPYEFVNSIKDLATTGKIDQFVFFRDLKKQLHFCSLNHLLDGSSVATFELKAVFDPKDEEQNIITGFLPFNEKGDKVYPYMRVLGKFLSNELELKTEEASIAKDAKDTIPFVSENEIDNDVYFGRQFNPDIEYEILNKGLESASLKFILDKAVCIIPFNVDCIAGKTVDLKINVLSPESNEELSEYYSGTWLIEQSFHSWAGDSQRSTTKLILCRKSVKPVHNSALNSKAFKDK